MTLLVAGGLVCGQASAHEFWLAPTRYAAAPGRPVEIGAVSGTGFRGERKPFSSLRCVRFSGRAATTLELARVARNGDLIWLRFAAADGRGFMAAYQSDFTPIELPADAFAAYLSNEGLEEPLAARRRTHDTRPGRERYRRCAKTWLAGSDPTRATKPLGMPLEIVPRSLPGGQPALRVRVIYEGRPLAGGLVKAWRAGWSGDSPSDAESRDTVAIAWQGRTDARGEAVVPTRASGEWLLSVVHMVPCRDRSVADWESTWASLTFGRTP